MKLIIIGPFPMPVHGCSLANEVLLFQLNKNKNIQVTSIDTNSVNVSSKKVGHFSFSKVFSFVRNYKSLTLIRKTDIVYTTPGQTFFGIVKYIPFFTLCIKYQIPYIIHVHGNHLGCEYKNLNGIRKVLFKYFISKASAGIVLSDSLRDNFKQLLSSDKIFVVENFAQDVFNDNKNLKKPTDILRIVYLSNLMKEKGILDVLSAFSLLKEQGIHFRADIAGKIEDESKVEIEERLENLKDYVTYHGIVQGQSKVDLLKKSNVFILPTFYKMEGQPIALIEAMATGNIVITTKHAGIPDIISVDNGFFVEPQAPNNISEQLLKINNNLEQQVLKISKFNMKYAYENFSEEQFSTKILNVLLKVKKETNV